MGLIYPNGMDYVCLFTPDGRATGTPLRLKCGKLTFPRDGIRLYAIYGKLRKANESCHWMTLAFGKWAIRTVGVATWATRWRLIVIARGGMMGLIYPLRARTYGCWGMILLKFVLTGRAFVFIINVILQKAMKEKQIMGPFRELPGGARQQGCKAFRSGAANDEFDGYARYSGTSWPKGKLGGNAGISTLVPLMGREFFYWYGRRLSLRSSRSKRWKYEESVQFQCRSIGNAFGSPQGSSG